MGDRNHLKGGRNEGPSHSRTEHDATPFTPAINGTLRPHVALPSYMDVYGDLQGQTRDDRTKINPGSMVEQNKPLIVRPAAHQQEDNREVYKMTSRPKGHVLLFNNITCENHPRRDGAEKDEENLVNLFRKLGYRVECHRDLTQQGMKTKIGQFARRPELLRVDSTFVVAMSHGEGTSTRQTQIVTRDDRRVDCQWIVDQFNTRKCPAMRYKPKIFLFQLCRGEKKDGYTQSEDGLYPARTTQHDGTTASDPCRLNDDVLVAHATVQGYVSFRNPELGAWFIQAICEVYSRNAHTDDIETMHKTVDNLIKHCKSDDSSNAKMQTCTYKNQGFNKFYFYPGIYRDRNDVGY